MTTAVLRRLPLLLSCVLAVVACSATPARSPSASPGQLAELLASVPVVDPSGASGYDRRCGPGHGCVFGPPWTDATGQRLGHNGCDTRSDLYRTTLRDVVIKAGTNGCVPERGVLDDPYTGQTLIYTRSSAAPTIEADHVYPLKAAWDAGAWAWPPQRRIDFANDIDLELIAVSASANHAKGDSGPGSWLPPNQRFRCGYLARYLQVAVKWELSITTKDAAAVRAAVTDCAEGPAGSSRPVAGAGS